MPSVSEAPGPTTTFCRPAQNCASSVAAALIVSGAVPPFTTVSAAPRTAPTAVVPTSSDEAVRQYGTVMLNAALLTSDFAPSCSFTRTAHCALGAFGTTHT